MMVSVDPHGQVAAESPLYPIDRVLLTNKHKWAPGRGALSERDHAVQALLVERLRIRSQLRLEGASGRAQSALDGQEFVADRLAVEALDHEVRGTHIRVLTECVALCQCIHEKCTNSVPRCLGRP